VSTVGPCVLRSAAALVRAKRRCRRAKRNAAKVDAVATNTSFELSCTVFYCNNPIGQAGPIQVWQSTVAAAVGRDCSCMLLHI
jgi:hypothetical protein